MTTPQLDACREEQDNEKEAIQSIYEKEAQFALNSWKIWRPIDVVLRLQPSESGSRIGTTESRASADLHVACTDRYPDDVPRVEVLNVKGIAMGEQTILKEKLAERVKEKKGECMILDLAELVREFLADNRPKPKGSFHQEMLEKQRKEESEMKRAAATMAEIEKAEIESEQEKREEERRREKEEARDEGRRRRESEAAEGGTEGPSRRIGSKKVFLVAEDIPQRKGLHPLCHEWFGVWERESILVSEWKFTHNLGRKGEKPMQVENLQKRLNVLEKEADTMVELEEMDDSLSRIAFVVVNMTALTPTNISIRIFIAQRIQRTAKNLENVFSTVKKDESALRRLTLQIVCGLRWLHDQNMVHGTITASSIWQMDGRSFLLSDCVILRLVQQVAEAFKECTGVTRGGGDAVKKEKEKGYTKKKDVFALGCMLDQLALRSPDCSSDSSPPHTNELTDFIRLCQSSGAAEELLDHPFLLQDVQPTSSTSSPSGSPSFSRASRLIKEFNIFKWLGKGGFGEVTLARNKLDGNDYAVKTIALNPGNESLNRRVTREAKIFSKLNHPNVVRYFAAWTEDVSPEEGGDGGRDSSKSTKKMSVARKTSSQRGGMGGPEGDSMLPSRLREIEARAVAMSDWSSSYQDKSSCSISSSSDDDSNGGAGQLKGRMIFSPQHQEEEEDSYEILFERSGPCSNDEGEEESECEGDVISTEEEEESTRTEMTITKAGGGEMSGMTKNTEVPPTRILYIQMEYCARGTLRSMIDRKSFVDNPKKIWRVFGEILSGLQYIHKQDMIHRDIKPMNILLDSKEHVKIGDFGLATRQFLSKITKKGGEEGVVEGGGAKALDLTMDIGTELYMAPELFKSVNEIPYTNKIDVYSAGIVLFEMFHRPLPPGMERISTLKTLKTTGTVPLDFAASLTTSKASNARRVIESMLSVDANDRPSVTNILEDDRISFNDSDEDLFRRQLLKTVKSRSGLLFKSVMETLVKEEPTKAQAYLYDSKICKERFNLDRESSMGTLIGQLANLLHLHSFKPLSSPLLRASMHGKKETSRTKPVLMVDQTGFPVTLPLDLRANFVRMVSRNNVSRLKRYTIGRSFGYGELPGGIHPTERWECSIDAVGPIDSCLTLSLSIVSILLAIAAGMVEHQVRCVLRVGHIGLIRAALLHAGIGEEKHQSVLHSIAMKKGKEVSKELQATLPAAKPTSTQLSDDLKSLLRSRDERVREGVKNAIDEMEKLQEALRIADESSLSRVEILIDPLLVARPAVFSDGLVFQLELQSLTQKRPSILAQGGRYDHLLVEERHSKDLESDTPIALIGCSVSLDLLVNNGGGTFRPPSVVVCSHAESFLHEMLQLTSALRKRGVITDVFEGTMKENGELTAHFDEFDARNRVEFVLVFLHKDEVLVEPERIKMSPSEALDYVSSACIHQPPLAAALSTSDTTLVLPTPITPTHKEKSFMARVDLVCGLAEKWQHNTKKKIETQVANTLAESMSVFKHQTVVNVVVVSIDFSLVKQIAAMLTRSSVPSELINLFDSLQKSHGKAKEELEQIFEVMLPFFKEKPHNQSPIVLFRHKDNMFRYIM
ncbi:hypothetical protein PENTCL1PPCAC_27162 [Pristionchus entomophagus]|uniref:non-specific serine/threonine protein kinase n=1 Tax=Pristionchus entomophagus TaxID=358040 RepID=A0AAV5UF99_9BILA|nr:hypothetical protein PENTCL1PPCAC_27162 [Pristionchus entomophagus]